MHHPGRVRGLVSMEARQRVATGRDHDPEREFEWAPAASDIPGLKVSSGLLLAVGPGGVFVVEGAGFEASVQDADEPVGETSQGVVVADAAGAELVVAGAGTG